MAAKEEPEHDSLLQEMLEDAKAAAHMPASGEELPPKWHRPVLSVAELPHEPPKSYRESLIEALNERIDAQLAAVLEHPTVDRLREAWRRLHELVDDLDFDANIQLELFVCTKDELFEDFERSTSVTASGLYSLLCDAPSSHPAEAVGLLVADYDLEPRQDDMALLANLAAVAADAHAPLLINASPSFLGCDHYSELTELGDIRTLLESPRYASWSSFRKSEDARYVVVCIPHAAGALAAQIADAFASSGWFEELSGQAKMPVDASSLRPEAMQDLVDAGFALFEGTGRTGSYCIARVAYRAKRFADTAEGRAAAAEDASKASLSNTLSLCRLAHYLEALAHAMPEGLEDAELQATLQSWLEQQTQRLQHVRDARIAVSRPSYRRYELSIDVMFDGEVVTQALAGRLD